MLSSLFCFIPKCIVPPEGAGAGGGDGSGGDGDGSGDGAGDGDGQGGEGQGDDGAGDGDGEAETPEQKASRLEGELAARDEELARLREEAGKGGDPVPVSKADSGYKDAAAVEARAQVLGDMIEFLYANLDGYTGKDAQGNETTLTAAEVRAKLAKAHRELAADIPAARAVVAERERARARARREYPTHFDAKHPDFTKVRAVFAEAPGLESLPNAHALAADVLRGRAAKGSAGGQRQGGSATPPRMPTGGTPPPPAGGAGKKTAVTVDGDALRRGERGTLTAMIAATL